MKLTLGWETLSKAIDSRTPGVLWNLSMNSTKDMKRIPPQVKSSSSAKQYFIWQFRNENKKKSVGSPGIWNFCLKIEQECDAINI